MAQQQARDLLHAGRLGRGPPVTPVHVHNPQDGLVEAGAVLLAESLFGVSFLSFVGSLGDEPFVVVERLSLR